MSIVNHVQLIGGLGRDPELRKTTHGTAVASFSIATEESYKDKSGNKQKKTEWHNCVAYGKTAEVISQWFKKGTQCVVVGKLVTTSWDDKNGGPKRYKTEIVVESWTFQKGGSKSNNTSGPAESAMDEEMPF